MWSDSIINSNDFKHKQNESQTINYTNPQTWKFKSQDFVAQTVTLGKYNLPKDLIVRIPEKSSINDLKIPKSFSNAYKTTDGFIIGNNQDQPQIGDYRITFKVVKPQNISIMAQQEGSSFGPFQTPYNSFYRLDSGLLSIDGMIAKAESENTILTWILRFVGWLLIFIGVGLILKPLSVLADIIPLIGSLVEVGNSIVSFLIATPLALTVIALAWIAYRPLLGIPLLLVSGFLIFTLWKKAKAKKQA